MHTHVSNLRYQILREQLDKAHLLFVTTFDQAVSLTSSTFASPQSPAHRPFHHCLRRSPTFTWQAAARSSYGLDLRRHCVAHISSHTLLHSCFLPTGKLSQHTLFRLRVSAGTAAYRTAATSTQRLNTLSRHFSTASAIMAPIQKECDYLVLGGGSGGLASARRASGMYLSLIHI